MDETEPQLRIRLDNHTSAPIYRQIVEAIKNEVALGSLAPGERLPTVRQLAQELAVDRNTTLRAYRVLDREGVVSLEHGRGTFVRTPAEHPHLTRHRQHALEALMDEPIARALSLGYKPDAIAEAFSKRMDVWQRARRSKRTRRGNAPTQAT